MKTCHGDLPQKIINPVFMRVYKQCRRVQIPLSAPFLNRHNRAIPHGYGGFCIFHTLTTLNKIYQKYIIFSSEKQKLATKLVTFYIVFFALQKQKQGLPRSCGKSCFGYCFIADVTIHPSRPYSLMYSYFVAGSVCFVLV